MKALRKMLMGIIALALLAPVVVADAAAAGRDAGDVLASHTLTSLDGSTTQLSAYKGDVVVVNFWASWCGPCRKELPVMDAWHAAWVERGAKVVAISIDSEMRNAKRFAKKVNLKLPVFHDGPSGLAKTLDLPFLPCTFVLDRDGKVVSMTGGSSAADLAALRNKVEALLSSTRRAAAPSPTNVSSTGESQ